MKVLTDTHTLVWALSTPEVLGFDVRAALSESPFMASVVNLWELILRKGKPGALIADPLPWWEKYVVRQRIPTLPVRAAHVRALGGLADVHKDTFDRILLAQAMAEGFTLATKDPILSQYGVSVIW